MLNLLIEGIGWYVKFRMKISYLFIIIFSALLYTVTIYIKCTILKCTIHTNFVEIKTSVDSNESNSKENYSVLLTKNS